MKFRSKILPVYSNFTKMVETQFSKRIKTFRSEILPIYSNFAKMVETQFSKRIKTFHSDNVLEYTQYAFQALLHSCGIVHHLTCPGTSQ